MDGLGTQRAPALEQTGAAPKMKERESIVAALENPKYVWRTVGGISRETKIDPSRVTQTLRELSNTIIESSIPDEEGHPLFTTRRHYKARAGTFNRIISAVSDVVK